MTIYLNGQQAMQTGLPVGTPIEVEIEFEGKAYLDAPMINEAPYFESTELDEAMNIGFMLKAQVDSIKKAKSDDGEVVNITFKDGSKVTVNLSDDKKSIKATKIDKDGKGAKAFKSVVKSEDLPEILKAAGKPLKEEELVEGKDEAKVKKIIKDLQGDFGGDNSSQGRGLSLLKGLAFSDEAKANEFMKALNTSMTTISKKVLGESKEK